MSKLIALHGKYGKGKFTIVDDDDYQLAMQYKWVANEAGYAVKCIYDKARKYPKTISLHQLILPPFPGFITDHINRNRLDNRRSNLRHATRKINAINASPQKGGTSQYIGVNWNARQKRWHARITVDGETIHLGWFKTELEAARARDEAAKEIHGEYAVLNFTKTR